MKKISCLLLIIITVLNCLNPIISVATDETLVDIQFKDVNLYNAIVEELGSEISSKDDSSLTIKMTQEKIEDVEKLYLIGKRIADISGLNSFTNLRILNLHNNQISDISSLSGLTSLKYLHLDNNQISDISSLSGLTSLRDLELDNNQISNISSLSGLTSLMYLTLDNNQISDISSLSGLTKLFYLDLSSNRITDLEKVKQMFDNMEILRAFFLEGQKVIIELDEEKIEQYTEIDLPDIFKEAQNTESDFYTGAEIICENCEYDSNTKKIKINKSNKEAKVYIGEDREHWLEKDKIQDMGLLYATTLEIYIIENAQNNDGNNNGNINTDRNEENDGNVNTNKENKEDKTVAPSVILNARKSSIIIALIVIIAIVIILRNKNKSKNKKYKDII